MNKKYNGQTNVSEWYKECFPHDDWGCEMMNKGITFQDVFECLQVGGNIYAFLGAGDSIVRERVFDALATMMNCGYEVIYYQWLNHEKKPLGGNLVEDMSNVRFSNNER